MLSALYVPPYGAFADPTRMIALAQAADEAGYDGFFVWDHVSLFSGGTTPLLDPIVMLGAIAQATQRLRLGAMVTPLSRRRPWKFAKEMTTLDQLSGGRMVCGVGLGGAEAADFEPFGEVSAPGARARRLDAGLEILDPLLRGDTVNHSGRDYALREARITPACVQLPRMPIWVAAARPAEAGFRRAARWDGCFPLQVPPPGWRDWNDWWLGPAAFAETCSFLRGLRDDPTAAFDYVASGRTLGSDGDPGPTLAAYRDAGATWWFDWVAEDMNQYDRTLDAVRRGPPRPA